MTSILTNLSASAALQTLRVVNQAVSRTQNAAASGLRIGRAADNAAYWSIATTMTSDRRAVSAVADTLGIAAAKVDTAYAGLSRVLDVLGDFKAKLVAAKEPAVDTKKVQDELTQLKGEVQAIASGASFNGVNFLSSDIADIHDGADRMQSVASAFVRTAQGNVSVETADFDLGAIALFNSTGGGLLQADPRDVGTIGGLRFFYTSDGTESVSSSALENRWGTSPTVRIFNFTGPFSFGASDTLTFDVTVDADNPADGIPGPYDAGTTTRVTIDQALVNSTLGVTNGHIADYTEYMRVLDRALTTSGANARATTYQHPEPPGQSVNWVPTIDEIGIYRIADPTKNGSSLEINVVSSTIPGNGGFDGTSGVYWGSRQSQMTLHFSPFRVAGGVVIDFDFSTHNQPGMHYSIDKDYINTVLGTTDGSVATAADMASLLNSLVNRPDVIIADNGSGGVTVKTDPLQDRKSGERSGIAFFGVSVNIEPIPRLNFMDIDIAANPSQVGTYLAYIETVSQRIAQGGSILGSLSKRIDGQTEFARQFMASIATGVGRLVDADMEDVSSRLAALQTQQQLAVQSLSIANSAPKSLMTLFQS